MRSSELLTTAEVAERLKKSEQGVRRLIRMKRISAVNIGTELRPEYRVPEDALEFPAA
jgi:excisionase family DNA binding protein